MKVVGVLLVCLVVAAFGADTDVESNVESAVTTQAQTQTAAKTEGGLIAATVIAATVGADKPKKDKKKDEKKPAQKTFKPHMIDRVTRMPMSLRRSDIRYTDGGSPRPIIFPARPRLQPDNRVEADIKMPGDEERARIGTYTRLNSNHYFEPRYDDEHPHVHIVPHHLVMNGFPITLPGTMIRRFQYPTANDDDGPQQRILPVYAPHGSDHLYALPSFPPLPTDMHQIESPFERESRSALIDHIIERAKARRSSLNDLGLPESDERSDDRDDTDSDDSVYPNRRYAYGAGETRHLALQKLNFAMDRLEALSKRVEDLEQGLGATQFATLAVAANIDARDEIANKRGESVKRMRECLSRLALQIAKVERKLARGGLAVPVEPDDLLSEIDFPRDGDDDDDDDDDHDTDGPGGDHDIDGLFNINDDVDDDGSPISLTVTGGSDGDFDIDFSTLFDGVLKA